MQIILCAVNYSLAMNRELPFVRWFGERGMSYLGALRNRQNRIVLLARERLDEQVVNYHFDYLISLDSVESASARSRLRLICLSTPSPPELPLDEAVYRDRAVMSALKKEVREAGRAELVSFAPSRAVEAISDRLNVEAREGAPGLASYWGSKEGSRTAFRAASVEMPAGSQRAFRSVEELTREAWSLARRQSFSRKLVLKLNSASWGNAIGNCIIGAQEFASTKSLERSVDDIVLPWPEFAAEVQRGGAVVEEYLSGAVSWPSGQGRIDRGGETTFLSAHEQVLQSDQYVGCYYPVSTDWLIRIRTTVESVGRVLARAGVLGSFGVDFLAFSDGRLVATEINLRQVATSHVFRYAMWATAAQVDMNGLMRARGRLVCYSHSRVYLPSKSARPTVLELLTSCRRCRLLYSRSRCEGAVFHILGALEPCGYIEVTSIAADLTRARQIERQVRKVLETL